MGREKAQQIVLPRENGEIWRQASRRSWEYLAIKAEIRFPIHNIKYKKIYVGIVDEDFFQQQAYFLNKFCLKNFGLSPSPKTKLKLRPFVHIFEFKRNNYMATICIVELLWMTCTLEN